MGERCGWVTDDPLYIAYHDTEWGVPVHDSRELFELLTLEGFQAGLNWLTILKRREGFREAFQGFDPYEIAGWGEDQVVRLLADTRIIRHRGKIEATIGNARAWAEIESGRGFAGYLWDFVDGRPSRTNRANLAEVPAQTEISQRLSKDLKKRGFRFVGPTIAYAFMQAAGMVNDHVISCPRHTAVAELG